MNDPAPAPTVRAQWFDGRQAHAHPAIVRVAGTRLIIDLDDTAQQRQFALADIRWPPTDPHGARILSLPDGSSLHSVEAGAWRALAARAGIHPSLTERLRGHALAGIVGVGLLLVIALAGYRWAIPWTAWFALQALPASVDAKVGEAALASIDGTLLRPSALSADLRHELTQGLGQMLRATESHEAFPVVLFRRGSIGPNAFALPGGVIVVTDELVALAGQDRDMILGVLAHEYGHVKARHGMRLLLQSVLLGTIVGLATGDVSGLITGAPLLLSQLAYSRDHEREADETAIALLLASHRSPAVMAEMLSRLASSNQEHDNSGIGVLLSSHPATADRIRRFQEASVR
ncbi:MAG: M48 family metallopeptidase [Burkholderiaceae bacterium]